MDNLQRIFGQPTGYDEENKPDPKKELREKVTLELGSVIYIATISGRGSKEVIEKYIKNQGREKDIGQLRLFEI